MTEHFKFEIDLHGYSPLQVDSSFMSSVVATACKSGWQSIRFIHGHALWRNSPRPFANTNTGVLGLSIRKLLRNEASLRQWIKHTTIDCSSEGSTSVKLKSVKVSMPERADFSGLPAPQFAPR